MQLSGTSRTAGIVLCGGRSQRMGRAKADLLFGSETLLERVVGNLLTGLNQVVVVHAADQVLPKFDARVVTIADPMPFGGPLIGLQAGLKCVRQLPDPPGRVFLTSCDAPFLQTEFVQKMLQEVEGHDVAVPVDEKYFFPLAAAYQTSVWESVDELVEQGERRPRKLFDICDTVRISPETLRSVDPDLSSLVNLNTPEDYRAALIDASLPIPAWLQNAIKDG